MTPIRSFDELSPGQVFDLGSFTLTREEVLEFAGRYDPQPFHLSDQGGRESPFGQLVASGLHTMSAAFGHMVASGLIAGVSRGGNAMEVKWPAPLTPDDPVDLRITVEEVRALRSKPDTGLAKLRYRATRQRDGVLVLDILCTHFLAR